MNLLEVSNLTVQFGAGENAVRAVNGVSFAIEAGSVLGIVGESGCGKTVTALSLMRLIELPGRITNGEIVFSENGDSVDLLKLGEHKLEKILGNRMAMIFQDPLTALNPVLTIGFQIAEPLRIHRGMSRQAAKIETVRLLKRVGISDADNRFNNYPHEFSGGMRQRVMIAMAIACQPKLIIADEPTTALDVTIQAQILNLLRELKRELGTAIIIITHDLGVIARLADRVAVMYGGRIVENAPVADIFNAPQHPYTRALIGSVPNLKNSTNRLTTIEGAPPRITGEQIGCAFQPRCLFSIPICQIERPHLIESFQGHFAACHVAQREESSVNV